MGARTIRQMFTLLTAWAEAVPIRDETAKTVAKVLVQNWISRYGVPFRFHSDQRAEFDSDHLSL